MAASPNSPLTPGDLLSKVLGDVRAGRFSPELKANAELVYANREAFRDRTDEVSFGRAHSLLWEVYDQAGMYPDALNVIEPLSKKYLSDFETAEVDSLRVERMGEETLMVQRLVARQKVMCCLAYSFALYRRQQYQKAKRTLDLCETFLTDKLVDNQSQSPFPCWGSLARLHYFYGQVLRAERIEPRLAQARERFDKALECVWKRLEDPKMRSSPRSKVHREHLFAKHCAAKVLAFGFGWTSLLQGELAKAQEFLRSARVLLHDSNDRFLVWQLELFFYNVLRAKNGGTQDYVALLQRMEQCSSELKGHPDYYLQSLRHLAVAHFNIAQAKRNSDRKDSDDHLAKGKKLVAEALPLCRDNPEYQVLGKILSSRLAGVGGERRESMSLAEDAYTQARDERVPPSVLAEAAIALAEALCLSNSRPDWALELLKAAREKGGTVVRCAAHLHLSDLYLKLNDVPNAVLSFASWEKESKTVEHEWLRQKAESLARSIVACRLFWVQAEDKRKYKVLLRDLQRFLVDREKVRQQESGSGSGLDEQEAADQIGVNRTTLRNWQDGWRERTPQK